MIESPALIRPSRQAERAAPRRARRRRFIATAAALLAAGLASSVIVGGTVAGANGSGLWTRSLVYAQANGRPLTLDEYAPLAFDHSRIAVLVVHGGGWAHGSADGFASVARALARHGFAAFDVDYSLASNGHPGIWEQLRELQRALWFINRHSAVLGVERDRVGALGSSAGGNLVTRLALSQHAEGLRAVISWSGPMDLTAFQPLMRNCTATNCGNSWLASDLVDYVGCLPARCRAEWNAASPADNVRRFVAPMLLFNSAHELVPLKGTKLFAARLRADGDRVRLVVYRGHRHAGEYGSSAIGPTIAFLQQQLGGHEARGTS